MKIEAPFNDEQYLTLCQWQTIGIVHPFTCGGQPCTFTDEDSSFTQNSRQNCLNEGILIPDKEKGWVCPCGKYTQNWCHDFMVNSEYVNTLYNKMEELKNGSGN